jgi:hypothetical protein
MQAMKSETAVPQTLAAETGCDNRGSGARAEAMIRTILTVVVAVVVVVVVVTVAVVVIVAVV